MSHSYFFIATGHAHFIFMSYTALITNLQIDINIIPVSIPVPKLCYFS